MPRISDPPSLASQLSKPAAPVAPPATAVAPATPTSTAVAVPCDLFTNPDTDTAIQVGDRAFTTPPYVVFAHPLAKVWQRILAAVPDVQEGDPVLVLPEPHRPVKLAPFRFLLIAARHYFADVDTSGEILAATWERPEEWSDPRKEHVESAVIVLLPDRAVPATARWKTTKCPAAHRAVDAVRLAGTPAWARISADHAASMSAPDPRQRAVMTVRFDRKTSKSSGRLNIIADATVAPTSAGDAGLIKALFTDPAGTKTANAVASTFQRRVEEITRIAGGPNG